MSNGGGSEPELERRPPRAKARAQEDAGGRFSDDAPRPPSIPKKDLLDDIFADGKAAPAGLFFVAFSSWICFFGLADGYRYRYRVGLQEASVAFYVYSGRHSRFFAKVFSSLYCC